MVVNVGGVRIKTKDGIEYLGLQLDPTRSFRDYASRLQAAEKANKAVNDLGRILHNMSVSKPRKRRLLTNVVHSLLLYGAPIWASKINTYGWKEITPENLLDLMIKRRECWG